MQSPLLEQINPAAVVFRATTRHTPRGTWLQKTAFPLMVSLSHSLTSTNPNNYTGEKTGSVLASPSSRQKSVLDESRETYTKLSRLHSLSPHSQLLDNGDSQVSLHQSHSNPLIASDSHGTGTSTSTSQPVQPTGPPDPSQKKNRNPSQHSSCPTPTFAKQLPCY